MFKVHASITGVKLFSPHIVCYVNLNMGVWSRKAFIIVASAFIYLTFYQVLAEEGKAKAVAFDEIDKAPEEKKRGITIATVGTNIT